MMSSEQSLLFGNHKTKLNLEFFTMISLIRIFGGKEVDVFTIPLLESLLSICGYPVMGYFICWVRFILLTILRDDWIAYYSIIVLFVRSYIFTKDVNVRFLKIFSITNVVFLLGCSLIEEVTRKEEEQARRKSALVNIFLALQFYIDSNLYIHVKVASLRVLNRIGDRILQKLECETRFLYLFSHTTRNIFATVSPFFENMSRSHKYTEPEEDETSQLGSRSSSYLVCLSSCRNIERTIFNILTYQLITNGKSKFSMTKIQFNMGKFLSRIEKSLTDQMLVSHPSLRVNFTRENSINNLKCMGETKVLLYIIGNVVQRFLSKSYSTRTKMLMGKSSYDPDKEVFVFELVATFRDEDTNISHQPCPDTSNDGEDISHFVTTKLMELCWMGGQIEYWRDRPGPVNNGRVCIPLESQTGGKEDEESSSSLLAQRFSGREINIVVAEDNKLCRHFYMHFLDKIEKEEVGLNLRVKQYEDGREAFDEVKKMVTEEGKAVDIIVTDNDMPHLSGVEMTRKLREEKLVGNGIIYLITGATFSPEKLEKFDEEGLFDGVISKPILYEPFKNMVLTGLSKLLKKSSSTNKENKKEDELDDEELTVPEKKKKRSFIVEVMKGRLEDGSIKTTIIVLILTLIIGMEVRQIGLVIGLVYLSFFLDPILSMLIFPDNDDLTKLTSDLIRRASFSFLLNKIFVRACVCCLIDTSRIDGLFTTQFKFSTFVLSVILLLELFFYCTAGGDESTSHVVQFGIASLVDIVMILKGFKSMTQTVRKREEMEELQRQSIKKLVVQKQRLDGLIMRCSGLLRFPIFVLEHYSKTLYLQIFESTNSNLINKDQEERALFVSMIQKISRLRKDNINLSLITPIRKTFSRRGEIWVDVKNMMTTHIINELCDPYMEDENIEIQIEYDVEEGETTKESEEQKKNISPFRRYFMRKRNQKLVFVQCHPHVFYLIMVNLFQNMIQMIRKGLKKKKKKKKKKSVLKISVEVDLVEESMNIIMTDLNNNNSEEEVVVIEERKIPPVRDNNNTNDEEERLCILTRRSVKVGEETGDPKLGIGELCIEKVIQELIEPGRCVVAITTKTTKKKEEEEEEETEEENMRMELRYDFSGRMKVVKERIHCGVGMVRILVVYECPKYLHSVYADLVALGFYERNIVVRKEGVSGGEEEEDYDIMFILEMGMVRKQRNEKGTCEGVIVVPTKSISEIGVDGRFIYFLYPLRKLDICAVIEQYLFISKN